MESKYLDRRGFLSRYAHQRMVDKREAASDPLQEFGSEKEWARALNEDLPRFIPFLKKRCHVEFHGRILEIGAGAGWLSGELSKLPKVVEITTTDFSPKILKEHAPRVFKLLNAHAAKITRTPADFHDLGFPDDHFDFVVSSSVLHHATNIVQVLCEVKRVLKPGGRYIAIREPVSPFMKRSSRGKGEKAGPGGLPLNHYTLKHYKESFKQAALPLEVKRVNLSHGFRYYVDEMVNGITHARFAFIGRKRAGTGARRVGI
jgi:ubiquinone/menaquinone biosynthesis C-methylase UbiE